MQIRKGKIIYEVRDQFAQAEAKTLMNTVNLSKSMCKRLNINIIHILIFILRITLSEGKIRFRGSIRLLNQLYFMEDDIF